MERKGQITIHGLPKDRTVADNEAIPGEAVEGPATFASRMVRGELEEQRRDRTLFQWSSRPWVLAAMFACCVGILLWTFWPRPKPDPEELFVNARPLMNSTKPEEWEEAWDKYLAPLAEMEGQPHHEEIQEFRQKMDDQVNLRRALAGMKGESSPASEGQRFYQRGLRLCRLGEYDQARQVWQSLIDSFENVGSEARWVQLARAGLAELGSKAPAEPSNHEAALAALKKAKQLKKEDKKEDAQKILKGLYQLYEHDASAQAILKRVQDELKQ
jgi:tetratricopeptide (TPR) repeat protein